MKGVRLLVAWAAGVAATPLFAEQQVTLKTGAVLVGDVEFAGDALVVEIEGAKQRVPLADVASVAPAEFGESQQARRLLVSALEARILGDSPGEAVGLLAEAARLAPDNPQIAFWYANMLVDSGSGKAASKVLEAHRAAIEDAYSHALDDLAARIELRLEIEKLPPQLVERIDAINVTAPLQPADANLRQAYAVFRILDQYNDPVAQTSFQVQSFGNDDRLESFPGGYFLHTFSRHRHSSDQACRVEVNQYGLKPQQYEFQSVTDKVAIAGEFIVHRFADTDKLPFVTQVLGAGGAPLAGARVSLQPSGQAAGAGNDLSATTDAAGRAKVLAYPGAYAFHITAKGFNAHNESFELATGDAAGVEHRVTMHAVVSALIRLNWAATTSPAAGVTTGATLLELNESGGGGAQGPEDPRNWVRPIQVEDRVALQWNFMPMGHPMAIPNEGTWIRKLRGGGEDSEARRRESHERFTAIDLKNVDDLADEFQRVNLGNNAGPFGPVRATTPAEYGSIFVGKATHRDMRTGQPMQLTFKLLVEWPTDADAP